jgi:predicted Zn-dependent protease
MSAIRWALVVCLLAACGVGGDLRAGREALDRGDLVAAEAAWRRVLDREPENDEALYGIGWTWHLAGKNDAARGAFQQLVALKPDSALGYKGLASLALADGNAAVAREGFEAALKRAPGDVAVRQGLGLAELAGGDPAKALTIFDDALVTDPSRAELYQARAEALLRLHRDEEALEASAKAVDAGGEPRVLAMSELTRARAILAVTAGRVDSAQCASTAPPVYTWLGEADQVLDRAEARGIDLPSLSETRRAVRRRRGVVDDTCPGLRASLPTGGG